MIASQLINDIEQVKQALDILTDTERYAGCSDNFYRQVVSLRIQALKDNGVLNAIESALQELRSDTNSAKMGRIGTRMTESFDFEKLQERDEQ